MKKGYVIAECLNERQKQRIREEAAGYGFEMGFFENAAEADGKVSDAEILFSDGDSSILEQMPHLKWCHTTFAGIGAYTGIAKIQSGETLLTNGSGAYGRTISEHIIMAALMLLRRMTDYNHIIYNREWTHEIPIRSVADSTVVIVGTGDIGSATAEKFKVLGAKSVVGFNRSGRDAKGFDEIHKIDDFEKVFGDREFAESVDLLVLTAPGTPESEGIISKERIAMLPEKAYVINIGRGSLVDQDALMNALNEEKIAGAALDVMYPEPLPKDHPLWDAKNCIITPHISGNMSLEYTVDKTVDMFCDNLKRYAAGEDFERKPDLSKGY